MSDIILNILIRLFIVIVLFIIVLLNNFPANLEKQATRALPRKEADTGYQDNGAPRHFSPRTSLGRESSGCVLRHYALIGLLRAVLEGPIRLPSSLHAKNYFCFSVFVKRTEVARL